MDKFLIGIVFVCLFIMVFPDAKTAWDSFITTILEATSVSGGLTYLILTNMPLLVILAAIVKGIWSVMKGRNTGGGL